MRLGLCIAAVAVLGNAASAQETSAPPLLSAKQCIAFALDHSRQIRDARLGERVAGKQVREAWGAVFPEIDATLNYTRNLTSQTGFFPSFTNPGEFVEVQLQGDNVWNTLVQMEQPLFQAEAFIGVGAAGRFKELQAERKRGTTQDIVTNVREHYYGALLAAEEVRLTEASLHRVRRTLQGAIELEKAGLGNSYDILRLEVELARLDPVLRRARNDHAEALRNLKVAMGYAVDQELAVSGSLHAMNIESVEANAPAERELLELAGARVGDISDLADLTVLARQHRSSLLQARLDTRLSQAQLSAARAAVYPKLYGFASYAIFGQDNGAPSFFGAADQRATNWQAGVRVEIPLLEGGARYARMSQRSLQLEQSKTRQQLEEQQIENEVRTLVERLVEARDRVASQRLAIQQAQRGFEIASTEFRSGLNTQFNALDSEVALRETEFNYAQAVFEVLVAQARLDRAVGIIPLIDAPKENP